MKRHLVKVFLIIILTIISSAVYSADFPALIEFKENGIINWTAGVVEAKGIGAPSANIYYGKPRVHRQETVSDAVNKARHNLLETIVGLRINSGKRVIDIVENYPLIMIQLRDMANNAPEIDALRNILYDGTVEVWSQLKLSGGFSQLILPPEITHIESIKQVFPRKNPLKLQTRLRSSNIYSGMVVDARGLQAVPVLAPKILDENLEEVFGPAYASREFAVQNGMTLYTTDLRRAKFHSRVSYNPLIVKALKALWPDRCDFIISNADAAKLRSASEHLAFLKECRVIIVLDPM